MKLLIAEDDDFFVKVLTQILAPDHELIVTRDGNEAWASLQRPHAPRLAILDWGIPGLSGPEICRRVRASALMSSTYLIILTAKNSTADLASGLRSGADDYVTKPPVPGELRARVAIGERILALQDTVEVRSAWAHRSSEQERAFREGVADGPFSGRAIVQENLRQVAAYLRRRSETADYFSHSSAEVGDAGYRLSTCALENSHS